jgi:hypothetical protein
MKWLRSRTFTIVLAVTVLVVAAVRLRREECAPPASTSGLQTQCLSCKRWSPHSDWYAQ